MRFLAGRLCLRLRASGLLFVTVIAGVAVFTMGETAMAQTPEAARMDGAQLYTQHCSLCHGAQGAGVPGVFPPLAGSDYLTRERDKALRAAMEGLAGKITVNGTEYHGAMPPVLLDDEDLAQVYTHVFTSWGNALPAVTAGEIAGLRAKTKFPTLALLKAAMVGTELPSVPEGWEVVVGAELNFSPVRLARHPDGESVLAVSMQGDLWVWQPGETETRKVFAPSDFIDPKLGSQLVGGITVDDEGRLYLTSNQRQTATDPVSNEVTIFRTGPWQAGKGSGSGKEGWEVPRPWLRLAYPFGVGPYNHGVSHIAQGPDGMIYVNSGSRTDGGEAGTAERYARTGEDPLTACLWRLNPDEEKPRVEVYARGLRNSYGFCWDSEGRLMATENGPDAHAPEELNRVEPGKHYGFPYVYADWKDKAYPHTPDAPAGLAFTLPYRNTGPAAGGSPLGLSTFDAHSCPSGMVWLDETWPAPLGGSFLAARFGNLLKLEADVGYDVLQLRPDHAARTVKTHRLLAPLGRPIDVLTLPGHRVVIAEYCRGTSLAAGLGTPGRLLMLRPVAAGKAAPEAAR